MAGGRELTIWEMDLTSEERKTRYLGIVAYLEKSPDPDICEMQISRHTAMAVIDWARKEESQFGIKHLEDLQDAIYKLKDAFEKDPNYTLTPYYLGIAHLSILKMDPDMDQNMSTDDFERFCRGGADYFAKTMTMYCPPFGAYGKLEELLLLAKNKGIDISTHELFGWAKENEDEDERADMIEQNEAENLKERAKNLLKSSASIKFRGKRARTIAEAIDLLDEVLSINPEDRDAEDEMGIAYDLLSKEADKVKSSAPAKGIGEVSLSTNDNKKEEKASSAKETKILAPAKGEGKA